MMENLLFMTFNIFYLCSVSTHSKFFSGLLASLFQSLLHLCIFFSHLKKFWNPANPSDYVGFANSRIPKPHLPITVVPWDKLFSPNLFF